MLREKPMCCVSALVKTRPPGDLFSALCEFRFMITNDGETGDGAAYRQSVIRAGGITGAVNRALKQRAGASSMSQRDRKPL
jgi:hypothetical protein